MKREKINWTWKKIVGTALGILGIGTITSCYGMPEDDYEYSLSGQVKGKIDGTEQTIPGIVVELNGTTDENSEGYSTTVDRIQKTNSEGCFHFEYLEKGTYTLRFTDTDGDANGKFKQQEHSVTLRDYETLTINLQSDE